MKRVILALALCAALASGKPVLTIYCGHHQAVKDPAPGGLDKVPAGIRRPFPGFRSGM